MECGASEVNNRKEPMSLTQIQYQILHAVQTTWKSPAEILAELDDQPLSTTMVAIRRLERERLLKRELRVGQGAIYKASYHGLHELATSGAIS